MHNRFALSHFPILAYAAASLLAGVCFFGAVAPASAQVVSSTKNENPNAGYSDSLGNPTSITDVNNAFDFSGQTLPTSFAEFEFTMSVNDGDTEVGDFDYNNLTLQFRGTENNGGVLSDSAWVLNGFRNNYYDTKTFTFSLTNAQAIQLTSIINGNNRVIAQFLDATPADNYWDFHDGNGNIGQTTLKFGSAGTLTAVPEASSLTLIMPVLGMVGVTGFALRRRKK